MKYRFIVFCYLLAGNILTGNAQNLFQKELAVGVAGGMTYSTVSFVPKVQQNMLVGLQGGLTVRWRTEKYLGLQAELNVKQQGWDEKFENTETENFSGLYYRRKMDYIELPFLTHIYFGGEKVQFFVNLGPQIGWLLHDKKEENLNGVSPLSMDKQHERAIDKRFEWGLGGGPGLELRTGIGSFLLEGRFYYALGDFYNTRKGDDFSKASSQVFSVKVAYLMPLF